MPENHAGFNINRTKLQVAEIAFENNQYKLVNLNEAKFNQPMDFENDGETLINSHLQTAMDTMQLKRSIVSSSASFTLPLETFLTAQLPFENSLLRSDQIEEFRWELSILFPKIKVEDLAIQYFEIHKNALVTKNTALVMALPKKFISVFRKFCANNNIKFKYIDNSHLAADRSLIFSSDFDISGMNLSIHISKKVFSLIVLQDGLPIFIKNFQFQEYSEIVKSITDQFNPAINKNFNIGLINKAFVSGEEVPDELISHLKDTLKIIFRKFNPFSKIKPGAGMAENILFRQNANSFAPAAGIAYRTA